MEKPFSSAFKGYKNCFLWSKYARQIITEKKETPNEGNPPLEVASAVEGARIDIATRKDRE